MSIDVPPDAIPETIRNYPLGTSTRTRLVHASQHPLIPAATCRQLIQSAIDATNRIGWTMDRHIQALIWIGPHGIGYVSPFIKSYSLY